MRVRMDGCEDSLVSGAYFPRKGILEIEISAADRILSLKIGEAEKFILLSLLRRLVVDLACQRRLGRKQRIKNTLQNVCVRQGKHDRFFGHITKS